MKLYWRQLSFLIVLFFLILILIQGSSLYLFYSYYFTSGIHTFYFGDGGEILGKTMGGLFEVVIPHLASQGIILFLISHFLVLFNGKDNSYDKVAIGLVLSGVFNIFAGPLVLFTGLSVIKIISYVLFQAFFTYSLYLIFKSFVFSHFISETKDSKLPLV